MTYLSDTGAPTLVLQKATPTEYYAPPHHLHGDVPEVRWLLSVCYAMVQTLAPRAFLSEGFVGCFPGLYSPKRRRFAFAIVRRAVPFATDSKLTSPT